MTGFEWRRAKKGLTSTKYEARTDLTKIEKVVGRKKVEARLIPIYCRL